MAASSGPAAVAAAAPASVPDVPTPVVPTTMVCPPGGIDLNKATTSELQQLPGVDDAIANRIIASRPILRPDPDLLGVAGIGAGKLAEIIASGSACATPPSLPPPTFDVCRSGDGRIDVNNPMSRTELARLFGKPTADRIVTGLPYWRLNHVLSEGESGAGAGKMSKYLPKLCVTPPTIDFDGVRWGWADNTAGGKVTFEGATLVAGPGVIDAPPGAWLSIDKLAGTAENIPGPAYPSYDLHVHGMWAGNGDRVWATVPVDPQLARFGPDWEPLLVHHLESGYELIHAEDLTLRDGNVTAPLASLSRLDSVVRALNWGIESSAMLFSLRFPAPSCPNPWSQFDANSPTWIGPTGSALTVDGPLVDAPTTPTPPFGYLIKHCVGGPDTDGDPGRTRFRNNTSALLMVDKKTDISPIGGVGTVSSPEGAGLDIWAGLFSWAMELASNKHFLAPGESADIDVPPATSTVVDARPHSAASVGYQIVSTGMSYLSDAGLNRNTMGNTAWNLLEAAVSCTTSVLGVVDLPASEVATRLPYQLLQCFNFKSFYEAVGDAVTAKWLSGEWSEGQKNLAIGSVDKVSRFLKAIEVGEIIIKATDSLVWGNIGYAPHSIDHRATMPLRDSKGRFVQPICARLGVAGLIWIVDEGCQDRYYASLDELPPECTVGTFNPQCQGYSDPGAPPDDSGCWQYDPLASAWVLDASQGQGCLLLNQGAIFCGVGPCATFDEAAGKIFTLDDERSFYVDSRGGLWHLATTDAYFSCGGDANRAYHGYWNSYIWNISHLGHFQYQGNRYGC